MTENLSTLVKEKDIQVQRAPRVPQKMNLKKSTPIKMQKVKDRERILKAAEKSSKLPTRELP